MVVILFSCCIVGAGEHQVFTQLFFLCYSIARSFLFHPVIVICLLEAIVCKSSFFCKFIVSQRSHELSVKLKLVCFIYIMFVPNPFVFPYPFLCWEIIIFFLFIAISPGAFLLVSFRQTSKNIMNFQSVFLSQYIFALVFSWLFHLGIADVVKKCFPFPNISFILMLPVPPPAFFMSELH